MKHILLPFIIGLLFVPCGSPARAQDAPEAGGTERKAGPCIELDKEEFDFGMIWQGEERKESVEVRNTGDVPLHISQVKSSCGCARSEPWMNVVIPPHSSRPLNLQLSNKEKKYFGKLKKSVQIHSDDPEKGVLTFWILLEIKADFWPDERVLRFNNVTRSGVKKQTVQVRSYMEEPLELTEISCPSKFITGTFRPVAPLDAEKGYALYALDIEVDGTQIAKNRHRINTFVSFKSNSVRIPKDRLLLQILFLGENIAITPDLLDFDACPRGQKHERTILLKHGEGKDFTVSEAKPSTPFLTTVIHKKGAGETEVTVTLSEHAPVGVLRGEIRLVINYNAHQALSMPVRARVVSPEGEPAPGKAP